MTSKDKTVVSNISKQEFLKYRGRTAYERVYAYLLDYIRTCPPDEKHLPYEHEITRCLQVSRNTVRHALAMLRENGIIRTAQRSGSRIVGARTVPAEPLNLHSLLSNRKIAVLFTSTGKTYTDHKPFRFLSSLEQRLHFYNADFLTLDVVRRDPELILQELRKFVPEAVINLSPEYSGKWLEKLNTLSCKTIHFDRDLDIVPNSVKCLLAGIDLVTCNHAAGIRQMLEHSCLNAEQIIYAAHHSSMYWAKRRAEVIEAFCRKNGIAFQLYIDKTPLSPKEKNPMHLDAGRFMTLPDETKRTFVFAQNDRFAIPILHAIRQSERKFPLLQVIGHDNDPELKTDEVFPTFGYDIKSCISAILNLLETYLASPLEMLNVSRVVFVNLTLCQKGDAL